MLVALDPNTQEGKAAIDAIQGGFMRAEWVDRERYAPTEDLEKAEQKIIALETELEMLYGAYLKCYDTHDCSRCGAERKYLPKNITERVIK